MNYSQTLKPYIMDIEVIIVIPLLGLLFLILRSLYKKFRNAEPYKFNLKPPYYDRHLFPSKKSSGL